MPDAKPPGLGDREELFVGAVRPVPADFVGRRIIAADLGADNLWRFQFDDGGWLAIEAEVLGGGIPAMGICEECARPRDDGAAEGAQKADRGERDGRAQAA